MNDRRWESLDPADEAFVEDALRAGRGELPDDARMRAMEGRLGNALEKEMASSGWWSRSWLYPVVGLAVVALSVRAGMSSPSAPSAPVPPVATAALATTEPAPSMPSTAFDSVESTPKAASVSVESLPVAEPVVPEAAKATRAPEAKTRPRPLATTSVANEPNDELALLEAASRALDASPDKALALTNEHMKRFRAPKFAQERERLAVVALVRLGRRDDAKRRADAFEAAFPESAHLTRVRELVRP